MSDYPTGVADYVVGTATVTNYFPINRRGDVDLCCEHCRFYVMRSRRCFLTDELQHYPDSDRGMNCPLEIESMSP